MKFEPLPASFPMLQMMIEGWLMSLFTILESLSRWAMRKSSLAARVSGP